MKQIFRRAVLALALAMLAGVGPAFAQAPPPIPALPDAERRTTYSISASACNCAVGFQLYGDSTDYANWLTVWINGVQVPQPGNWTLSVPTGSLATNPRPITNAVLTFITPQTGTVQIVGARRPRRTSQFTENRGVAARDMNQILSDQEAQLRELWDRQARTIQGPPGETLNILPILANRANQGACFDSGGSLVPCAGIPGSSLIAGNGIALSGVGPTTITSNITAGAGIRLSGSNPITISAASSPFVTPNDYNFTCDGVTDFAVQLQAMITASATKVIYIPPGPACLTSVTLRLPTSTTIIGGGREQSVIKGIGTGSLPIFLAVNVSNIRFRDFWCQGSDSAVSWTVTNYGCLLYSQSGAGGNANIDIQYIKQTGFKTNYWNYFSISSTGILSNITFSNNLIVSTPSDIPTDPVPNNNGNSAITLFSGSGGNGRIENVKLNNNTVQGTGLCSGLHMYGNIYKWEISGNLIDSMGNTNTDHCINGFGTTNNSYAIIVYDYWSDGNPPKLGKVQNNSINSPAVTGIYFAGDGDPTHTALFYNNWETLISGNNIRGQISDSDATLPRGAIVVANATMVTIAGNSVTGGFGGIAALSQLSGDINIIGNTCATALSSILSVPNCIRIAPNYPNTTNFVVRGNTLDNFGTSSTNGGAILLGSATDARFYTLDISYNTINGGWFGLYAANQFVTKSFTLNGNNFGGGADNYMANVGGLTGAPVILVNNVFDAAVSLNGNGLIANGSIIHMSNNKFANRPSGSVSMLTSAGACGTVSGTTFDNVAQTARVASGSLGLLNPSTCTLNYMQFVQDLTPAEGGTAGSKYINLGWLHADTAAGITHLPQRVLTGN